VGPMLLTGLACCGAAIAIGWMTTAATADRGIVDANRTRRGATVIAMAMAEGLGILGVVVGLLDINVRAVESGPAGFLAALPAVAGSLISLALIEKDGFRGPVTVLGLMFSGGLGSLGVVVGALASILSGTGTPPLDAPFIALGVLMAAAALAIAAVGAPMIREIVTTDVDELQRAQVRLVRTIAPYQFVGVFSAAVALLILFLA
jgi:F0F1-type ATP synthase membrane subunit c/vacuolar-type H+-ATPase subunit K